MSRPSVLIVGPYPPPLGGVATVVRNYLDSISGYDVTLHRTGKKSSETPNLIQVVPELYGIFKFLLEAPTRNADIYHIHTASYWSFIRNVPYVLASSYVTKGKVILQIHGGEFHLFFDRAPKIVKQLIRMTLRASDTIIITSPSWIRAIEAICKECTVHAVPNGFDPIIFHPRPTVEARKTLGLPTDKKILLTIGHLEEYKGQKHLIESMTEAMKNKPDVTLYIIGEGSLKETLNKTINDHQLTDHIFLAGGNKSVSEIGLWISACDVFVLPSLQEGNPTVMFEALGCGKPFVGTRVGGVPDVITSEDYGLLCNPGDPKDLAQKILQALDKNWDQEKIRRYSEQFTWKKITSQVQEVYREV